MFKRLDAICEKYQELQTELAKPEVMSDFNKLKELSKEASDLEETVNKYQEYRNNLVNDTINLLELVYYANYTDKKDRLPIQNKAMAKVEIIRYYIDFAYGKSIINKKVSASLFMKLNEINNLLIGWIKSDSEKS